MHPTAAHHEQPSQSPTAQPPPRAHIGRGAGRAHRDPEDRQRRAGGPAPITRYLLEARGAERALHPGRATDPRVPLRVAGATRTECVAKLGQRSRVGILGDREIAIAARAFRDHLVGDARNGVRQPAGSAAQRPVGMWRGEQKTPIDSPEPRVALLLRGLRPHRHGHLRLRP